MFDKLFRKKTVEQILKNQTDDAGKHSLARHLGVRDLTALGIAAIVGAGIFSTIGKASAEGGPAVIFLFLFTAVACGFAAFAYAEFASLVPVSGSAYTYSYVAFGELFAWIIGWALIMEYSIGNITVAISWSDYFTTLINGIISPSHVPEWMTMDYFTAQTAYITIEDQIQSHGQTLETLAASSDFGGMIEGYTAWEIAPQLGSLRMILDIPAFVIVILITWLVYRGIKESKNASNAMVLVKIAVVLTVIIVGAFFVDTHNWHPFAPNGVKGILSGVSAVFFAYIGFDAISTTAEECKDPQRDLPRGIMYSIIICTILYVAIALVITGMVNYKELNVGDPLAYVFSKFSELEWLSGVIAISAVVAMSSVLLVFQLGQPRIWMAMSRDGLLPPAFSRIHPKFKTPSFATIVTGLLVAFPLFFFDMNFFMDLCSIGTLFAFVLVCAGILKLEATPGSPRGKFRVPYVNAKFIAPVIFTGTFVLVYLYVPGWISDFFSFGSWELFAPKIPMYIFFVVYLIITLLAVLKSFSLIPLLGLLSCLYMMAQLKPANWLAFSIWLIIGLAIFFLYSQKNSRLGKVQPQQ